MGERETPEELFRRLHNDTNLPTDRWPQDFDSFAVGVKYVTERFRIRLTHAMTQANQGMQYGTPEEIAGNRAVKMFCEKLLKELE